jgi:hypothetical protein
MSNGFFVVLWKWHCIHNADASMSRFIAGEVLVRRALSTVLQTLVWSSADATPYSLIGTA